MKAKSIGALLISGLFAFSALFASAPASASDFDDEKDSSQSVESPSPFKSSRPKPTSKSVESYEFEDDDKDDDEEFDQRVKKKYGSRDHLSVPPLVVKPGHDDDDDDDEEVDAYKAETESAVESTSQISSAGKSVSQSETLSVTTPQLSSAVSNSGTVATVAGSSLQTTQDIQTGQKMDLTQVKIQSKTPAERFMDAALVGLAAMGAGAIGLGAMASSKALRRR
jgi:hypothetical protein